MLIIDGYNGGDGGIQYPASLYSYWKLDDVTGNAIDARLQQDIAEVGTVPSAAGKLGNARGPYTASTNNFKTANLGTSTEYDNDTYIIEAWFKITTADNPGVIFSKWLASSGLALQMVATGGIEVIHNGTTVITSATTGLDDSAWHYVVVANIATSGADLMKMYIDGSEDKSAAGNTFTAVNTSLEIGSKGSGINIFSGLIDDVAYHNVMPASQALVLSDIVTPRWNGGAGRAYSSDP